MEKWRNGENVNIFLNIFIIPDFEMKGRRVKMYESLSKVYVVGHENNLSNQELFVTSKMPLYIAHTQRHALKPGDRLSDPYFRP